MNTSLAGRMGRALLTAAMITGAGGAAAGRPEPVRDRPMQSAPDLTAPLSPRAVENLAAFARLLGCVRYFHASDGSYDTNWESFAMAGVSRVERAPDAPSLIDALRDLFAPIAPTLIVYPSGEPAPNHPPIKAAAPTDPLVSVAAWRHLGLGVGATPPTPFQSARLAIRITDAAGLARIPEPDAPFIADLGGGVLVSMPISVYVSVRTKTVPPGTPFMEAAPTASLFDRSARLGAVALAWAAVKQFWPMFEQRDVDWDEALHDALREAATSTPQQAIDALRQMMARLGDARAGVIAAGDIGERRLPVRFDWVESCLVIAEVAREDPEIASSGLAVGDVVARINGVAAGDAARAAALRVGASSPGARDFGAADALGIGRDGARATLSIAALPGEAPRDVELTYRAPWERSPAGPTLREVAPGVTLVRLEGASSDELLALRPQLREANRIIFDCRSTTPPAPVLGSFMQEAAMAPPMLTPLLLRPDQQGMELVVREAPIVPQVPVITARVVFIADARTIGQAEVDLMVAREAGLGPIVGRTTAGAPGEGVRVSLPAGLTAVFTGQEVRAYDGSRTFGVGVAPDVESAPTIAGLREGRDEALERAIEIISMPAARAPSPSP